MRKRADQPTTAIHLEVSRRPDRGRADIEGEDCILGRLLADYPCEILGMDRLAPGRALGQRIKTFTCDLVVRDRMVEVPLFGLDLEQWQQSRHCQADSTA